MTARRDRLARLLAIRTVRLRVVARALAKVTAAAASRGAIAVRLCELHGELRGSIGSAAGYDLKAAAAARAALSAATASQALRLAEAERLRTTLQGDVRRGQSAADAVARAVARAGETPLAEQS